MSLFFISFYQKSISPYFPATCRFYPSCSHYAKACFLNLPWYKAFLYTAYRILRCQPFSKGGYDPAPEAKK